MTDRRRVAAVTGGLAAAGALVGGVLGVLGAAAAVLWYEPPGTLLGHLDAVLFAGLLSAGFGAVLGPLAAWLLMRHVPLWQAIGGTALGTLAGAGASLAADSAIFLYPPLGFFLSALALRVLAGRGRPTRIPNGPARVGRPWT